MNQYYLQFIQLSMQQCKKSDYSDRKKLKQHNSAAKSLLQLQDQMAQSECSDTLAALLCHEDERVRINAANLCLRLGIHCETAKKVLIEIIDFSNDSTLSFSARMILQNAFMP